MRQNVNFLLVCMCVACLCGAAVQSAPAEPPTAPAPEGEAPKPFYFLGPYLFPYNQTIAGLIAGDVDGDGKLDLAFIDNQMSKIQMLLQKAEGDKQEKPTPAREKDVNKLDPDAILKKGDFLTNQQVTGYTLMHVGNKRPAIAYFCRTKELFIAARGDDGQWKNQQRFLVDLKSTFCGGFEAADLNGDGREDVILLAEDGVLVFVQQPDGKLAEPELYPVAEQKSSSLKFGDVNGDGRTDLIYVAPDELYPLRIRLTEANGAPGQEYRIRTPIPRDVTLGDVDNDGRNELVLIESTTNRIKVYRWGVEKKAQATAFDFGSVRLIPLPKDDNPDRRDFAAGDMDGDGLMDLLVTDPTTARMTLVRSARGKGLGASETFPSLQEATQVVMATLGREGPPSAFLISKKEGILGVTRYDKETGRLTYPQPIELPGKPQNVAVKPAGNDGPEALVCLVELEKGKDEAKAKLEIVVVEAAEAGYRVASRQPAAGLEEAPERLMALDVNVDGRTDLLALRTYQPAALLMQNAEGKFEDVSAAAQFRKHILRGLGLASVATGRLRDGEQPVMVVCSENLARAVAYENNNLVVKDQYSSPGANADFKAVRVADIDGDGVAEILLLESKSRLLHALKRNEKGVFEAVQQVEVGPFTVMGLLREDLDGDKLPEVIIVGRENVGVMSVGAVADLIEMATIETDEETARYVQVLVADLNADGKADIALRDPGQNQLEVFSRSADGKWASSLRFEIFESRAFDRMGGRGQGGEPRELLAADVTGDGLADMALIVHDRVIVYPQQK